MYKAPYSNVEKEDLWSIFSPRNASSRFFTITKTRGRFKKYSPRIAVHMFFLNVLFSPHMLQLVLNTFLTEDLLTTAVTHGIWGYGILKKPVHYQDIPRKFSFMYSRRGLKFAHIRKMLICLCCWYRSQRPSGWRQVITPYLICNCLQMQVCCFIQCIINPLCSSPNLYFSLTVRIPDTKFFLLVMGTENAKFVFLKRHQFALTQACICDMFHMAGQGNSRCPPCKHIPHYWFQSMASVSLGLQRQTNLSQHSFTHSVPSDSIQHPRGFCITFLCMHGDMAGATPPKNSMSCEFLAFNFLNKLCSLFRKLQYLTYLKKSKQWLDQIPGGQKDRSFPQGALPVHYQQKAEYNYTK